MPRSVDRQNRDAALHPAVVRQRHIDFFEAVHAWDGDHHWYLAAAVAGRQVKPAWNRFGLERDGNRFDLVVGEPHIVGKAFPLLVMKLDVLLSGVVVGPLGGAVVNGGHVPIVARGDRIAVGLGGAGLGLAPFRRAFEGRADVGHFLHARANGREIRIGFHAAGRRQIDRSRLIPVDAIGPNDVVERPALLREALGRGRDLCLGACDTMRDC